MKHVPALLLSVLMLLFLCSCYVYTKEPLPEGSVGPAETSISVPAGTIGPADTQPQPAGAVGPAR